MRPDIETLIFTAYHGELTDEERETLSRWVVESPENARLLFEYAAETRGIEVALRSDQAAQAGVTIDSTEDVFQDIDCDVMAGIIDKTLASRRRHEEKRHAEALVEADRWRALRPRAGRVSRATVAVAAVLGAAAIIGLGLWIGGAESRTDRPSHAALQTPVPDAPLAEQRPDDRPDTLDRPDRPVRPAAIGQVMEAFDSDPIFYTNGDAGNRNRIGNMPYGRSWYWFMGRGGVMIEAPAMWQMLEGDNIRLFDGRLLARAEEDAYEPLKILIDNTNITARGAEFGIYRTSKNTASILVYSGTIEVSLGSAEGQYSITTIGPGQTGVLQTRLGTIDHQAPATQADAAPFSASYQNMRYRPVQKTRSVRYVIDAPPALYWGEVEDSGFVHLIRELPSVTVSAYELAALEQDPASMIELSAGQVVDSYILHFAPAGDEGAADGMIEGTITFDRPILAVLGSSDSIRLTDTRYGSPGTAYPRSNETAGGPEGSASWGIELDYDYVALSQDRKQIFVRLHAGSDLDQVRILVEAR